MPAGPQYFQFAEAKKGRRIAACVCLRHDVCEMKRLYVKPVYRGQGIGQQLTLAVIGEEPCSSN